MNTARLIDVHEMAAIVGLEPATLRRVSSRQKLEANGCPPPLMTAPLKWSGPLVDRWIRGTEAPVDPSAALPPVDEAQAWRAKLAEEYGAVK